MNDSRLRSIPLILCICAALFSAHVQAAGTKGGALRQIEESRRSEHPVGHLERAIHYLEKSGPRSRSRNLDVITRIHRAVEAAKRGENRLMEALIKEAIEELRPSRMHRRRF